MTNHQTLRFRLDLAYDEFLSVYQGIAKTILVKSDDGRVIEFPAGNVQRYLDRTGIHGYFEMELTAENKFVGIRRLS